MTAKTAITAACILIVSGFAVSRIKQPNRQPYYIPTSEELYSNLYPLLKRVEFVPPSRVIKVNDPGNDGLLVVNQDNPQTPVQRLQKDQIRIDLVNQPRMGLILPKDHWMELGFDGILRDGPGPDLLIVSRHCRWYIKVFITDGMDKVLEMPQPECLWMGVCRYIHIINFDLALLDIPFEPHAVRVMGKFNNNNVRGIELYSVRARIQRTEP